MPKHTGPRGGMLSSNCKCFQLGSVLGQLTYFTPGDFQVSSAVKWKQKSLKTLLVLQALRVESHRSNILGTSLLGMKTLRRKGG